MTCESVTAFAHKVKHALTHPREWLTWHNVARVTLWILIRVYGGLLILFMLAVWQLSVDPEATTSWRWLSWLNGPATLILTSVVIGVVQVVAIVLFVIRHKQRYGRFCVKAALLKSLFSFLRLLLFQWTVLNITALFTSLSFFGLPDLQYTPLAAFIVCIISCLLQYALFVRYYLRKRRAFVYWRMRDCVLVTLPLSLVCLAAGVVFLINFVNYPLEELIRNYLIGGLLLFVFFVVGVPFVMYSCVLIPYQRHMSKQQYSVGRPASAMEEAIRRELAKQSVSRDQVKSLMLVGLGVEEVDGLERAVQLERLYLTRNKLSNLKGLQCLTSLETLHLEDNRISTFVDLLPLRSLPALRRLALERNPLCLSDGFELDKLVCLLPQLVNVNGMTITPAFRDRALAECKNWLHDVLCDHHRRVYDQSMQMFGSFVHGSVVSRSLGMTSHPLTAYRDSSLHHDRPHVVFYNQLVEAKRDFRLRQAHPPEPLPSDTQTDVIIAVPLRETAAIGASALGASRHKHAKSHSQVIVWDNENFV